MNSLEGQQDNTKGVSSKRNRTDTTYILPIFLQQRNKKVNTQLDVLKDLLLFHGYIPYSNSHTKNLLQLELDHCFCLGNLRLEGFLVANKGWKFSCTVI